MKNERILTPLFLLIVTLIHVGLVAVLWKMAPAKPMDVVEIEFVDLGNGGGEGGGEPAAGMDNGAEEGQPLPAVKPEPKQKSVEKKRVEKVEPKTAVSKPDMAAVSRKQDADFHREKPKKEVTRQEPKPEPKPEPEQKSETKPEPKPKSAEPRVNAGEYVQKSGGSGGGGTSSGRGGYGGGKGKGSGSGSGDGSGSGSGYGGGSSGSGGAVKNVGSFGRPNYPSLSIENGEEGSVRLRATVGPGGKVVSVEVIQSTGYARLDNEAKRVVRRSGKFSGPGIYTGTVTFRLSDN